MIITGEIYIEGTEVADIAVQIGGVRKRIKDAFDSLKLEVANMNNIWDSEAQDALSKKYKKLGEDFENFHKDLQAYENFLTKTAQEYGYAERLISSNAECFK